jgi:hypothetical protein
MCEYVGQGGRAFAPSRGGQWKTFSSRYHHLKLSEVAHNAVSICVFAIADRTRVHPNTDHSSQLRPTDVLF